jgi:CRP-like cAMP-binding protein
MDEPYNDTLLAELKATPLFAELDEAQLVRALEGLRLHDLQKGQEFLQQGQPAHHFFLVRSGRIKLYRISAEGQEKVVEIVGPGQTFGESLMFADRESGYLTFAEAIEPSVVLAFNSTAFKELLRESTRTCFRLMGSMSRRLHQQINEIDQLTLHDATYRLVNYLLDRLPAGVVQSPNIFLATSKSVIASRLSIKPETFSRILTRLSREGLIEVHGNNVVLRNIPALRELIGRAGMDSPTS